MNGLGASHHRETPAYRRGWGAVDSEDRFQRTWRDNNERARQMRATWTATPIAVPTPGEILRTLFGELQKRGGLTDYTLTIDGDTFTMESVRGAPTYSGKVDDMLRTTRRSYPSSSSSSS